MLTRSASANKNPHKSTLSLQYFTFREFSSNRGFATVAYTRRNDTNKLRPIF